MLIIPIKDGENIDRALKRFKRKFDRTGTMRQLRKRQAFTKPSVERRAQIQKAQTEAPTTLVGRQPFQPIRNLFVLITQNRAVAIARLADLKGAAG